MLFILFFGKIGPFHINFNADVYSAPNYFDY